MSVVSNFGREALFLKELAHQPDCSPLVAPALNQHVENLALVIDGAHKYIRLAAIRTTTSSSCRRSLGRGRDRRNFRAIPGPNFKTQRRTVS